MNRRNVQTLIVSILILLVPTKIFGFTNDIRNDPTKLIEKYLSLDKRGARLEPLTSETLKPYINWTDEPVWGHAVVISDYTVIDDVTDWEILSSMEAIIPVTFRIVGTMYWETATFLPDARMEVTRYRIKAIDNRWRILEPMRPPHVGRKRLINFVRQALLQETDEERARKLRLLRDALKQAQ